MIRLLKLRGQIACALAQDLAPHFDDPATWSTASHRCDGVIAVSGVSNGNRRARRVWCARQPAYRFLPQALVEAMRERKPTAARARRDFAYHYHTSPQKNKTLRWVACDNACDWHPLEFEGAGLGRSWLATAGSIVEAD